MLLTDLRQKQANFERVLRLAANPFWSNLAFPQGCTNSSQIESHPKILCHLPLSKVLRLRTIGDVFEPFPWSLLMSHSSNPAGILPVLLADSNRMQSRLLANALQRRPEFRISICPIELNSIRQAIILARAKVLLISSNASDSTQGMMETMHQVHLAYPEVAKILLTESYDRGLVISAFRSGARGIFCLSNTHFRLLCRCIQRVAEGQIWANSEQTGFLLDLISEVPSIRVVDSKGWQLLTPREEQVVALVAEGLSNSEVARDLKLSVHTVKKYLFSIFDKLGVSSRVELVLHAVNHSDRREVEWVANRAGARSDRLQI